MAAPSTPVRIAGKFTEFVDHWSPKIIGQISNLHLKAVKIEGEFVWHTHPDAESSSSSTVAV